MATATHADRVAAATHADSDNRVRYRGQLRRGQMPRDIEHATAVRLAIGDLEHCREMLESIVANRSALEPRDLREQRATVRAKLALVGRMIDDVVEPMTFEERVFDKRMFGREL